MIRALVEILRRLCGRPAIIAPAPRVRIGSVRGLRRPSRPVIVTPVAANAIRTPGA